MTPVLRKIHGVVWLCLAILLPLGWLAAIFAIPAPVYQQPIRPDQPQALPVLMETHSSGDFVFNCRRDDSGTRHQLEIFIKKPQNNPGTQVFEQVASNTPDRLLGTIQTRGIYRFDLTAIPDSGSLIIILKDPVQNRILRTVKFK